MQQTAPSLLLPLLLLSALAALISPASAATWYFLRYWAPAGQAFTSLSGDLAVPRLPRAGVYYLWPGLQPADGTGVYQNVLDGRSGTWWIGSGWCCASPSLPWGGGFNTAAGETVAFANVRRADGVAWSSELVKKGAGAGGQQVRDEFALADKTFNQVLFAIELTDVSWDFGPLVFSNVKIVSTGGTDSKWCTESPENYNGATVYSITGASASVSGNTVTCSIQSVTLSRPA